MLRIEHYWVIVQQTFTEAGEKPEQFGKIVRKRKEQGNIDKVVEAMFEYATLMAAWVGGELAEQGVDISVFLYELASQCITYVERTGKDFSEEVVRKRIKLGLQSIKKD